MVGQSAEEWKRPAHLDGLATSENPLTDKALKAISELPKDVQDKLAKEKLSKVAAEAINRGFLEPASLSRFLELEPEQRQLTEKLLERAMSDATGQLDPKAISNFAKFQADEMKALSERNLTLTELNAVLRASEPGQSLILANALKNGTVTVENLAEIAHLPAEAKAVITDLITHDLINTKNRKALADILAAHRKGELTLDMVETIKKGALSDSVHPDAFKNLWADKETKKIADEILDKQIKDLKDYPSEALKPERLAQILRNLGDCSTLMQAGLISPEMMKEMALSTNPVERAVVDMLVENLKLKPGRRVSPDTAARMIEMARNGALAIKDVESLGKEFAAKDSKMDDPKLNRRLVEMASKSSKERLEGEVLRRASGQTEAPKPERKISPDRTGIDHIFQKPLEVVGADGKKVSVKGVRKPLGGEGEVTYLVEGKGGLVPDAELTKAIRERMSGNTLLSEGLANPTKAVDVLCNYAQASQDVHSTVGFDTAGKLVDYKVVASEARKSLGPTAVADGAVVRFRSESGISMVVKFKPEEGKKTEVRSWGEADLTNDKLAKLIEEMKIAEPEVRAAMEKAMKEYLQGNPKAVDFESCKTELAKLIREGKGGEVGADMREVFKSYGVECENGKPKFENGHLVLRPKTEGTPEQAHAKPGGAFEKCKGKLVPIMMIVLAVAHQSQDRPTLVLPAH